MRMWTLPWDTRLQHLSALLTCTHLKPRHQPDGVFQRICDSCFHQWKLIHCCREDNRSVWILKWTFKWESQLCRRGEEVREREARREKWASFSICLWNKQVVPMELTISCLDCCDGLCTGLSPPSIVPWLLHRLRLIFQNHHFCGDFPYLKASGQGMRGRRDGAQRTCRAGKLLPDLIMLDTCHHAFVQTCRLYHTRVNKPQCKRWTLGGNGV